MRLTLDVGTLIDAPVSRVWRLMTDTQTWTRWGPSLKEVDSPERFIRAGLTGRIRTPFGIWAPFTIEAFEPEQYWDWWWAAWPPPVIVWNPGARISAV